MVLPHRIELWTSPLPRGCSTTELRQQKALRQRIIFARANCHTGLSAQGKASTCEAARQADNAAMANKPGNGDKSTKSGARAARLAAALRENLRRRKAQARQRSAPKPTKDA